MQEIRPESLIMLAIIPLGIIAFVIFLIVGAIKFFRKKDAEKEIYTNIARQMNWNFSARGEGFEPAKPYFEYINQQILPDRIRLDAFPVNILWGNSENTVFAVFDFHYNGNLESNIQNLRSEKGVLIISNDLNSPAFEVVEKDNLLKGFDYISGNSYQSGFATNYQSGFATNYQIKANNQAVFTKFSAPEIAPIFENNNIVRVLGNGNLLCLFFRRSIGESPDLSRIQFQLNLLRQTAKSFGIRQ